MSDGFWPSSACETASRRSSSLSRPAWSGLPELFAGRRTLDVMPAADTEFGAFTDNGPWVVDPDALVWRPGLDRVRQELHESLPELVRAKKLPPGARVGTTVRHLGGALLSWYVTERRHGGTEKLAGISRRLR